MPEMEMLQSRREEMRQERKATGAGALVQAVAEDEPVDGAGAGDGDGNAFACENAELCVSLGKTRGNASGTMHRDCIMG